MTDAIVLEDYDKGTCIGRGSTSLVYSGVRKMDSEPVAIKQTQMFELPEEKRERCLKEVQLLQSLHHPNIISLEESFLTENHLVLILEFADCDLRQLLDKQRTAGFLLTERHLWGLFTQLTGALRYMHQKRIMHRDIKPSNVLVTKEGLKLGDLGLGRQFSSQTHEAFSKVGTPYYVSPEVVRGDGYDFKSDVWSLGCLLYELATLQNPFEFEGATLASVFAKILNGDFNQLDGAHHSPALKDLVLRMLQVDPAKRPALPEVDDVICKEFMRQCDMQELTPAECITPLEQLACGIRPRMTSNHTSVYNDDIPTPLPNMPALPAIDEKYSWRESSQGSSDLTGPRLPPLPNNSIQNTLASANTPDSPASADLGERPSKSEPAKGGCCIVA